MHRVRLPDTEIIVSRFAFGTASLHHITSARCRENLVAAAVDHGFTHFDTAPYYGFGQAERSLARILAAGRCLTVATKVGLYPPGGANQWGPVVLCRKAAGRMLPKLSRPIAEWSVKQAKASLDSSLTRLGRDYVDILFLHEPDQALVATDEWLRWLEHEKSRVGHFGIAGNMHRLLPFIVQRSPFAAIVQTNDSLDLHEAEPVLRAGRELQLTYGYMSAARLRSKAPAQNVLAAALALNTTGAIVVSTRQTERLAQYSRLATFSAP